MPRLTPHPNLTNLLPLTAPNGRELDDGRPLATDTDTHIQMASTVDHTTNTTPDLRPSDPRLLTPHGTFMT